MRDRVRTALYVLIGWLPLIPIFLWVVSLEQPAGGLLALTLGIAYPLYMGVAERYINRLTRERSEEPDEPDRG